MRNVKLYLNGATIIYGYRQDCLTIALRDHKHSWLCMRSPHALTSLTCDHALLPCKKKRLIAGYHLPSMWPRLQICHRNEKLNFKTAHVRTQKSHSTESSKFSFFPETFQTNPILTVCHPVDQRIDTRVKHSNNSSCAMCCTTNLSDAKRRKNVNGLSWKPT